MSGDFFFDKSLWPEYSKYRSLDATFPSDVVDAFERLWGGEEYTPMEEDEDDNNWTS